MNPSDPNHRETAAVRRERKAWQALDALPVISALVGPDGSIKMVNSAWWRFAKENGLEDLSSISPGVNYLDVCRRAVIGGDESAKEALEGIEAVLRGELHEFELEYPSHAPNKKRWYLMKTAPLEESGHAFIIHLNITERRLAEEALRKSMERYRMLYEDNPAMYFTVDSLGTVLSINRFGAEQLGYSAEELVGRPVLIIFHPDDRESVSKHLELCIRNPNHVAQWESRKVRKDGSILWVKETARAVLGKDEKKVVIFVCEDITARKRLEQELRRLSSKLLEVQETEKKRIANEIHDSVGQSLHAIRAGLKDLLAHIDSSSVAAGRLNELLLAAEFGIEEVKNIYMGLRPSLIDDLGVVTTVVWYLKEFRKTWPDIYLEEDISAKEEKISEAIKIIIFRVLQGALDNVVRHSRASRAQVSLQEVEGRLELVIRDNGAGFDLGEFGRESGRIEGVGLASMQERVESSGGTFVVKTASGEGTRIRASWPCA